MAKYKYKPMIAAEKKGEIVKTSGVRQRVFEYRNINEVKYDVLKYQGLLRRVTCLRYKIEARDYDVLLYLNSEGVFSARQFAQAAGPYGLYRQMLNKLIENGHISIFRERSKASAIRGEELYTVDVKWKSRINIIYAVLNFEREYGETSFLYNTNARRHVAMVGREIKRMNAYIRAKQLERHQQSIKLKKNRLV